MSVFTPGVPQCRDRCRDSEANQASIRFMWTWQHQDWPNFRYILSRAGPSICAGRRRPISSAGSTSGWSTGCRGWRGIGCCWWRSCGRCREGVKRAELPNEPISNLNRVVRATPFSGVWRARFAALIAAIRKWPHLSPPIGIAHCNRYCRTSRMAAPIKFARAEARGLSLFVTKPGLDQVSLPVALI